MMEPEETAGIVQKNAAQTIASQRLGNWAYQLSGSALRLTANQSQLESGRSGKLLLALASTAVA
jgi:hypothetical protein